MRLVLAALIALASVPALAQTQYADSSGVYLQLNTVSFDGLRPRGIDGGAGLRLGNGVDVGLRFLAGSGTSLADREYDEFQIGPVAGVTRALGSGFIGRVEGNVLYGNYGLVVPAYMRRDGMLVDGFSLRGRNLTEDVSATVGRRFPIVGSLAFQPALGGFAAARQRLSFETTGTTPSPADADYSVGIQIEIPITFRVLGRDAAFAPVTRFSIKGAPALGDETLAGGGFRLNL